MFERPASTLNSADERMDDCFSPTGKQTVKHTQNKLLYQFRSRTAGARHHGTHIKRHFQNILCDLQDAGVAQLAGHTQPRVGRRHGVTKLLDRDDNSPVRNHWEHKKNINQDETKHNIIQKDRKVHLEIYYKLLCTILLTMTNHTYKFFMIGSSIKL